jgi:ribosomal protein RSM22 (predicted rRNA methylase)
VLPERLQLGIERELHAVDRTRLARAAEQITENYRGARFTGALSSPESRAAYLLTRMPATFAACAYVLREIARRLPEFEPHSLLDLGAGPGTAMWAAREVWPTLAEFTLIEGNLEFQQLGARLAGGIAGVNWVHVDANSMAKLPSADLVVFSYSLGELKAAREIIERAWLAALKVLVIIEPGTPKNFSSIVAIRTQLIEAGAHVIAPCPHTNACPLANVGDWCHFAVRVERSAEHRRLKGGTLGYEDEKFSYLAFGKQPANPATARIVRHPAIHGGHIQLTLCSADGLKQQTVTRSDKQMFRAARKAEWGDAWPPDQLE